MKSEITILLLLIIFILFLAYRNVNHDTFTPVALMPTMYQETEPRVRFSDLRREVIYDTNSGDVIGERYGNT